MPHIYPALRGLTGLCFGLSLLAAPSAFAQNTAPADLERISKAQAEAKAKADALSRKTQETKSEVAKLKKRLQRSAAESASYEKASRNIDGKLTQLTREEALTAGKLTHENAAQRELLAAFQRLSETPPPALLLRTQSAREAARAAIVMKDLNRQLSDHSAALTRELRTLSEVRSQIHTEKSKLSKNETELAQKRAHIRKLVKTKAELVNTLSEDQRQAKNQAAALAAKADDLRELISRFERAAADVVPRVKPSPSRGNTPSASGRANGPRLKPDAGSPAPQPLVIPGGARFADARGALRAPAQGTVKSNYGSGRKGLTLSTRPSTQVIAPFAGRIEFAGAFKNYENVVILNVGQNYFMLLTGLGEIYVSSGEMVTSGEPVGLMPAGSNKAELYIELRKNGSPVNPAPWLGNALSVKG